ncbi:MAG TPA: gliding motility protein [Myxococcaceae bacterium]|nr:gliding motility protein [Myxococcaceae bacterium]
MRDRAIRVMASAVVLLALMMGGCSRRKEREQAMLSLGDRIASGRASDLRTTPDGKFALYLEGGEKPRLDGVPPQMLLGNLYAVPTAGGEPREIGNAVTNVPGGFTLTPDSRWVLLLAGYNPVTHEGKLVAVDLANPKSPPVELGTRSSYVLASPDSKRVAFVAEGVLQVGPLPSGPFRQLSGEVQTADFTPDGRWVVYKRRLSAAGGLFVSDVEGGAPVKLTEQAGDFAPSPDSKHVAFTRRSERVRSTYDLLVANAPEWKPKEVASTVGPFAFSPDARWLARVQDQRVEDMGSTPVGALHVGPADGGASRKLANRVGRFEFAPTSDAIAFLDSFDAGASKTGHGVLALAQLPEGAPRRLAVRVPNFDWAPDGKALAYIARVFEPVYSIDLFFYALGGSAPLKLHPGVFGYGFDGTGKRLFFRTNCTGGAEEGRFCDLMETAVADPKAPARKVAVGIYTWHSSSDGARVLLTYARRDSKLYDAAVLNVTTGERKTIAQYIQLPALWAESGGERVVYVVSPPANAGVYMANRIP